MSNKQDAEQDWVDATDVFAQARTELEVGEMIHLESFSLFASMSAIELMDPKMDIGCGKFRDASTISLPHELSNKKIIAVMDKLMACEMTWLNTHTLPQTVFSCLYHLRIADARQIELLSYMRLQLGTMRLVLDIIKAEQIAEEEDFICWTYGFRLPPLTESKANQVWLDVSRHLSRQTQVEDVHDQTLREAVLNRLRFRLLLFRVITALHDSSCTRVGTSLPVIAEMQKLLLTFRESKTNEQDITEFMTAIFDPTVNRHLMTNTPPRTVPVLSTDEAFDKLEQLLAELEALCNLRKAVLPKMYEHEDKDAKCISQYSFHTALHAISGFSARHNPSILTRSIMKRMLLNEAQLFNIENASVTNMLLTDIGIDPANAPKDLVLQARSLARFAKNFVWSLLRNRGRQRRHLIKSLATWDRAVVVCFPQNSTANDETEAEDEESVSTRGLTSEVYCGKTPLQLVCHEISVRMTAYHFLLGFECDLYLPYEYATVYFFIGYVLSSGSNATASLAGAELAGSQMHESRLLLYLLDEGQLWLCRALYSFIEALTLGEIWDCNWSRTERDGEMFGTEPLWYEQRFGFTRSNTTGPSYVDYRTFRSLMKLQEESLLQKGGMDDVVQARLDDAANGFMTARRAFERASKANKQLPFDSITEDVRELARVAVSNSIAVSQQRRIYSMWKLTKGSVEQDLQKVEVSVQFTTHRHYPVIKFS